MREERIARLKASIEAEPNDSFSRYALALEYAGMNNTADATALLEDLIHRDPPYVPAHQQLGYLYQKLGRQEDARSIFTRGIEVAGRQGDSHAQSEMQDAIDEMTS